MKLQAPTILLWLTLFTAVTMVTARRNSRKGKKKDEQEEPSWKPKSNPLEGVAVFTRKAGSKVTLKCPADGNPKPKIIWSKDGTPVQKPDSGRIKAKKYNLVMSDLSTSDSGNYTCEVFNKLGNIRWTYALSVINVIWPLDVEGPKNRTVYVGEGVTFNCRVLNDPSAQIQWLRKTHTQDIGNSSALDAEKQMFISTKDNPEKLVLKNINMSDAGLYKCLVGNFNGLKYSDAWLTVLPLKERGPSKPTDMPTIKEKPKQAIEFNSTESTNLPATTVTMTTKKKATTTTTMAPDTTKVNRRQPLTYTVPPTKASRKNGSKDKDKNREFDSDRPRTRKPKPTQRQKNEGGRKGKNRKNTPFFTMEMTETPKTRPPKWVDVSESESEKKDPVYVEPKSEEKPGVYNSKSDKDMTDKKVKENGSLNDDVAQASSIDLWKVYIIVGAIAGGILLIGLVTLIVAVICGRREEAAFKSSTV